MATRYLLHFTYTNEALRSMINDPQDRRASFAKLAEKLGYRVGDAYYSITRSQALIFIEGPQRNSGFSNLQSERVVASKA